MMSIGWALLYLIGGRFNAQAFAQMNPVVQRIYSITLMAVGLLYVGQTALWLVAADRIKKRCKNAQIVFYAAMSMDVAFYFLDLMFCLFAPDLDGQTELLPVWIVLFLYSVIFAVTNRKYFEKRKQLFIEEW